MLALWGSMLLKVLTNAHHVTPANLSPHQELQPVSSVLLPHTQALLLPSVQNALQERVLVGGALRHVRNVKQGHTQTVGHMSVWNARWGNSCQAKEHMRAQSVELGSSLQQSGQSLWRHVLTVLQVIPPLGCLCPAGDHFAEIDCCAGQQSSQLGLSDITSCKYFLHHHMPLQCPFSALLLTSVDHMCSARDSGFVLRQTMCKGPLFKCHRSHKRGCMPTVLSRNFHRGCWTRAVQSMSNREALHPSCSNDT